MKKTQRFSPSGIPLKEVYGPADLSDLDYDTQLGDPGKYPFTRGLYPNMYRKTPWGTTQVTGFGLSQHTHQRAQLLAQEGQTFFFEQPIIHITFDLPTQLGLDSDNPMAIGEVRRCGVAVDSIIDMEELFTDLPLDKVYTSFITASTAAPILAMYVALAEERGINLCRLAGAINNNPLVTYIGENWLAFPPRSSLRLMLDVIRFCLDEMPNMNPVAFQMYAIRERGATAIQEDVNVVGLSILSGAHIPMTKRVMEGLREKGAKDIRVLVGGVIPGEDESRLRELGVTDIFTPGANLDQIVETIHQRAVSKASE